MSKTESSIDQISKHIDSEYVPELSVSSDPDGVEFFLEEIKPEPESAFKTWIQSNGARAFMMYLSCKQYLKEQYNTWYEYMHKILGK